MRPKLVRISSKTSESILNPQHQRGKTVSIESSKMDWWEIVNVQSKEEHHIHGHNRLQADNFELCLGAHYWLLDEEVQRRRTAFVTNLEQYFHHVRGGFQNISNCKPRKRPTKNNWWEGTSLNLLNEPQLSERIKFCPAEVKWGYFRKNEKCDHLEQAS